MLREIQGVRQDSQGLKRRWYQDEFFDLFTWLAADGTLVAFQVCYDRPGREHAITWHRQHGFSHNKVDAGSMAGRIKGTPLLVGDGRFPHRLVRQRFIKHAGTLDAITRKSILDRMREYGRAMARGAITVPRRKREPLNQTTPLA